MSKKKKIVETKKVCYVEIRKINWGYVFTLGIGTAILVMNFVLTLWYMLLDDYLLFFVFLINLIMIGFATFYYQFECYDPIYKKHYIRQEE